MRIEDPQVPERLTRGLNPNQDVAVRALMGPVLVVAGAGSGKTAVLTRRVAAHVATGADPKEILAITFTNKAAGEMRQRVAALVGEEKTAGMWVGTFHSICVRILRSRGPWRWFSIVDATDSKKLIKEVLADLGVDDSAKTIRSVQTYISNAKNNLTVPQGGTGDRLADLAADVYAGYQSRLRSMRAYDFDDLLVETVRLLRDDPEARADLQERFRYVLIDEYQDTNRAQYIICRVLADRWRNICAVGDADQSIYGWRGADVSNIARFETDYPDARVFTLDQNYRSSGVILRAARAVISENRGQRRANLWTDRGEGEPLVVHVAADDRAEADWVARRVRTVGKPGEHAILYRANFQSRVLEEALNAAGVPVVLVGGTRFYDRAEIRDAVAWIRNVVNPSDVVSYTRIVNTPRRGLGDQTVAAVSAFAEANGIGDPTEATRRYLETDIPDGRTRGALGRYLSFFDAVTEAMEAEGPAAALETVLLGPGGSRTTLRRAIADGNKARDAVMAAMGTRTGEAGMAADLFKRGETDRIDNLVELVNAAERFVSGGDDSTMVDGTFGGADGRTVTEAWLEHVALLSELEVSDDADPEAVRLMTLHAAKGLEFCHVTVVGWEEGMLPMGNADDIAEERRLAYVGITRAEETLALTRARRRFVFGDVRVAEESSFLRDILDSFAITPNLLVKTSDRAESSYRPTDPLTWESQRRGGGYSRSGYNRGGYRRAGDYGRKREPRPRADSFGPSRRPTQQPEATPAPKPPAPSKAPQLTVGARVIHPKFGEGVVLEVRDGSEPTAVVDFAGDVRTLMTRYGGLRLAG